jgi:hypothetical protein
VLPLDRLGEPVGEKRGSQGRLCAHVVQTLARTSAPATAGGPHLAALPANLS